MAKKVTRTIATTTFKVLGVDMNDKQTHEAEATLPRTYKNEAEAMKALTAYFAATNFKPVAVLSSEINNTLYEMPESVFLANATPIAPKE